MRVAINVEEAQKKAGLKRTHFPLRVNLFFFITFVLFTALIVRLALLQFVEGPALRSQESQNSKRDITISPIRGNIFDQTGFPIAYTVSAQSLFYRIEPGQKAANYIELAKKLENIFANYGNTKKGAMTAADIIKAMDVGIDIEGKKSKDPSYTYLPRRIKTNLSNPEIAYIAEHRDELQGVEISEESTRVYNQVDDNESIAAQLVGYLRPYSVAMNQKSSYLNVYKENPGELLKDEYVGFDGLEFMYQDELRGKNGSKSYPVNSKAEIVGQVKINPPEKGHNLQLTIHKDIQLAAQRAIVEQLAYMKSPQAAALQYPYMGHNAVAGYAVAMEVDTGRVVAMANYPDYDPNMWTGGISTSELDTIRYRYTNGTIMDRLPDLAAKDLPKHPSSLVFLGSTMKPLTVLLGLKEGLLGPYEPYNDGGVFSYGKDNNSTIRNSENHAYGTLTATTALQYSSNTFMASMIGNRMYLSSKYKSANDAISVWDSYMKQFGLGVSTQSGLPNESEGIGEYFTTAKNSSPQASLVFASFGQQGKYTVLQLAQYASMLANEGKRYKPQFVDKIMPYDSSTPIKEFQPELLGQVDFPKEYWNVVKKGMSQVFVTGFDGVNYTYGRKTGTSEQDVAGGRVENAVFIAFAPFDNPKLAVAVVVPEGGYGSWGAAPIARKIFDAYDQYVGLDGVPKGPK